MSGELMEYMRGAPVPRYDRPVSRRAKRIHDEVREAAFEADGALALGGHIMEGAVGLDEKRKGLQDGTPERDMMLADIMKQAVSTCAGIQANLYNGWRL